MRQHLVKGRYRFRKSDGSPDYTAVRTYQLAIQHALDLTPIQKARLQKGQARLLKTEGHDMPAICVEGIWIYLDRPKGTVEQGVGQDGTPWTREFLCNYGFFADTMGADDEPVDVYVGDDYASPCVWLIRQVHMDGTFDEYKVMLGFKSETEALRVYFAHTPAWCFGGVTELPLSFLVQLLACAPETMPAAMGGAVYKTIEKAALQKLLAPGVPLESAEWSTATVNTFPDAHFLFIEPGGEKDEEGKTRPRSLRHFPYRDASGKVDLPHLRNALSRIPQAGEWLSQAEKDRLSARARSLLDEANGTSKSIAKAQCYASLSKAVRRALEAGAMSYRGEVKPLLSDEAMAAHPVLTMPLTWMYEYPEQIGGWIGGMEDPDAQWVAFVDVKGHGVLWVSRDEATLAMPPYTFERPDLAKELAPPRPKDAPPFPPQEHLPSGSVVTEPGQSPIVQASLAKGKYDDIDFAPPQGVRDNFQRALDLHDEGHSGDGLQADTLAWARRLSKGDKISPDKVREGVAWFARHDVDRKPNWATEKTPGYVAWMAWGGDAGRAWMTKLKRQLDARDRLEKAFGADHVVRMKWLGKSIESNEEKRTIFGVVLEPEPLDGQGDAHGHLYDEEEVQAAQYDYCAFYCRLTDEHPHTDECRSNPQFGEGECTCGAYLPHEKAHVVECYSAPVEMVVNGSTIKKGSWCQRVRIPDDELWKKALSGEWNAFSIEGIGDLVPLEDM